MIFSAEMINFVRFSAMISPFEMTVFYRKSPSKSGNTLLRVKLSIFYDKENDCPFVMARGKSPPVEMREKKVIPKSFPSYRNESPRLVISK